MTDPDRVPFVTWRIVVACLAELGRNVHRTIDRRKVGVR